MNLPHHRRYQWQFVYRSWRRALLMLLGTGILAFLIYMAEMLLLEQNQRLSSELNHKSLIVDVHRLSTFGAPGYVKNDWTEGSTKVYLRRPR